MLNSTAKRATESTPIFRGNHSNYSLILSHSLSSLRSRSLRSRFTCSFLTLRARATRSLRSRYAASRGRQMPPSTRPRTGGKSRHPPAHAGCALLGGQVFVSSFIKFMGACVVRDRADASLLARARPPPCNATHRLPEARARANCLPAAHKAANAAIIPPMRGVRF